MKKKYIAMLALALLAGLFFFVSHSQSFAVKKIEVRAESIAVKKSMEKELQSLLGENIFSLDLSSLADAVLSKSTEIQTLVITRVLPTTLLVTLKERKGLVQVFSEKGITILDVEGLAFKNGPGVFPLFWPLPKEKKDLLRVLAWYNEAKPTPVNGLTWDRNLGLIVETKNRAQIFLGKSNFKEGWQRADESLRFLKSKGLQARIIDATYNARAVISL